MLSQIARTPDKQRLGRWEVLYIENSMLIIYNIVSDYQMIKLGGQNMSVTLYTHEWELLLQFVNNIHASQNFEEFCQTVLKQLPSAISFKKAVIFKYGIKDGQGIICDPHTLGKIDLSVLMSGSYPNWTEYLTFPNSAIIRQSDKYVPEEWEQTDMYKDFFAPHGVYWCLMMSIVN